VNTGPRRSKTGSGRNRGALSRLCLLFALLAPAGCSAPPDGETIRFGLPLPPTTLDPRQASDAVSYRICRLLYRSLVDFDETYRVVPALADWRRLGPRHYRFALRQGEGRRFHDGTRLVAGDVKATYDSIRERRGRSPLAGALSAIERIEAPDADRIDFFLSREEPFFPGLLTVGILPRALLASGHPFHERPVGSGPLRFLARTEEGGVSLSRVADGQRIELVPVREPVVRALKLARRELDLLQGNMPYSLRPWLQGQQDLRSESMPGNVFTYLGFNLEDPVAGAARIRQAIAHAIDRDAIVRHLMHGEARKASTAMPADHWLAHPLLPEYRYDPERARRLVREAGYSAARPPKLVYKTSSDPFRIRLATAIQHQLAQVGIEVRILPHDWGSFYGDITAGRFQLYSLSWVGLKLPDFYRYAFHSDSMPPAGANRGRLNDPRVDALIEQAERSRRTAEQLPLYRRLQERLHERLPYVPLWYESHILVRRSEIAGYRLDRDGSYDGLASVRREPRADRR